MDLKYLYLWVLIDERGFKLRIAGTYRLTVREYTRPELTLGITKEDSKREGEAKWYHFITEVGKTYQISWQNLGDQDVDKNYSAENIDVSVYRGDYLSSNRRYTYIDENGEQKLFIAKENGFSTQYFIKAEETDVYIWVSGNNNLEKGSKTYSITVSEVTQE